MTNKNIETWIKKFSESNNGYFLLEKQINIDKDLQDQAKILSENLDIDYLEKELNLVIRLLSKNTNSSIIKLSKKGIDVANSGGWIKYKEKAKNDNQENKDNIIKEVKELQKKQQ